MEVKLIPIPRAFPRICDPAFGDEDRSVVRDSEPDLCPVRERLRRLDKTTEQTQILYVRRDLSFRVEGGYSNPGDEWETLRAMVFERDCGTSISSQILFHAARRRARTRNADGDLVNRECELYSFNHCGSLPSPRFLTRDTNVRFRMLIGRRLQELREGKNLSQGDIEKRTGLLRCYISRVENGHTVPNIETLEKYARALEVPMYRFFYEGEEPPKFPKLPRNEAGEPMWGAKGKEWRELRRFAKALSRIDDRQRRLLLVMAQRMAGRNRAK